MFTRKILTASLMEKATGSPGSETSSQSSSTTSSTSTSSRKENRKILLRKSPRLQKKVSSLMKVRNGMERSAVKQLVGVIRRKRLRTTPTASRLRALKQAFHNAVKPSRLNVKTGTVISEDISNGIESTPVRAVCHTGASTSVTPFSYICSNELSSFNQKLMPDKNQLCCSCIDGCGADCECVQTSIQFGCSFIDKGSVWLDRDVDFYSSAIFACGPNCACGSDCSNSTKDLLKKIRTEVFRRNDDLGFGVRVVQPIETGTVVAEFCGEILTGTQKEKRTARKDETTSKWCFHLYTRREDARLRMVLPLVKKGYPLDQLKFDVFIDPSKKGNATRFINHGQYPNLMAIRLFEGDLRPFKCRLMFVAIRPIAEGEELFYDYGKDFEGVDDKHCLCNTIGCGDSGEYIRSTDRKKIISEICDSFGFLRDTNGNDHTKKGSEWTSEVLENKLQQLLTRKRALPKAGSLRGKKK